MVHHFAKWMASPQFNHPQVCSSECNHEQHKNKESILERFIKKVVKK
jgi:hypothetical protein